MQDLEKGKEPIIHSSKDLTSRLNDVFNTAIDGIITIDENGIVESINPAGARLFGYSKEEVIGNNVIMLMPPPYRYEHDQYMKRYQQTREPRIIGIGREVSGRKKDGTVFPMRLAVSESHLEDRVIYTGIVHDLTDVKQAEEKIHRLNQELEQKVTERTEKLAEVVNRLLQTNKILQKEIFDRKTAEEALLRTQTELQESLAKERELNELKSRFVSMASHEFRTPLSTILSSVALISRYTEGDQQTQREKHIERIKSAVNNMTGILNDFLSLSKLEEGKVECKPDLFYIFEFCEEVLDEIKGLLKTGQVIHKQMPDHNFFVFLDKRHLKNILYNLLTNAIKYSSENKPVHLSVRLEDPNFIISIRDEGIGIPVEDQNHLFTRFFRAHNAINIQGTGLGLNIVKRYVNMMNGTIGFVSIPGKGSTFTVILPLRLEA